MPHGKAWSNWKVRDFFPTLWVLLLSTSSVFLLSSLLLFCFVLFIFFFLGLWSLLLFQKTYLLCVPVKELRDFYSLSPNEELMGAKRHTDTFSKDHFLPQKVIFLNFYLFFYLLFSCGSGLSNFPLCCCFCCCRGIQSKVTVSMTQYIRKQTKHGHNES